MDQRYPGGTMARFFNGCENMKKSHWLVTWLLVAGLQGCVLQNPDTDQGLATMKDRVTTLVYLKAEPSLRVRLFRENATTRIFVANQGLSRLSAIELFLQVVNGPPPDGNLVNYTSGIPNFSKTPIVETGLVIPDLEPGEERDLGQLVGIFPTQMNKLSLMVTPLGYKNASTTFRHPLSGSFTGSYTKRDFGYDRSAGSLRGIIDSDGGFFFWLTDSSETTRISFLYGILSADSLKYLISGPIRYFSESNTPGVHISSGGSRVAWNLAQGIEGNQDSLRVDLKQEWPR